MRTSIAICSIAFGLALANPVKRQDLPVSAYPAAASTPGGTSDSAPVGDAAPELVVAYDPASVASVAAAAVTTAPPSAQTSAPVGVVTVDGIKKRAASCTTRSFNGPKLTSPTDTPSAFQSYAPFAEAALAAAQPSNVPAGYAVVPDFVNLNSAAVSASYLTYVSSRLAFYDVDQCAALCDAFIPGCNAFNIYYERVPEVISPITGVPDSSMCPANASSPSATLIKCAFFGKPLLYTEATNVGQWQGQFEVVMAGSNAYVKTSAPSLSGYEGPVSFNNAAINAPAPVIDHGYLRVQTFGIDVPYDPSLCAASCAAQTAYNAEYGTFNGSACVFFDAYVFYENGADGVLTCTYFSTPYGTEYATMTGQYDAEGNHYTVGSSYGYYLDGYYVE